KKLGKVDCLVQGTIYSDVLERGAGDISFTASGDAGDLHRVVEYDEMAEPLRSLFKDEVRKAGMALGMPEEFCYRQPFPGPGLAIRCVGEVTQEKLDTLREADAIFAEEVAKSGYNRFTNQYFAVMTDTHSVGVLGSERVQGSTIVLRSVTSDDFMTADWSRVPYEILANASTRITSEIEGITRVVYDITPKPPATVEWQ
ncbi:MAG: GMP synthase (glutamine-hydrolyzing), partial [Ruminococcus sp.]|nr:GMP synthase (glutamine-hydrolyzing) [Ruminococcus sp.]